MCAPGPSTPMPDPAGTLGPVHMENRCTYAPKFRPKWLECGKFCAICGIYVPITEGTGADQSNPRRPRRVPQDPELQCMVLWAPQSRFISKTGTLMPQSFVPSGRNVGSFVPFVEIMFQKRRGLALTNPIQGDQDACPRSQNSSA